MKTQKIMILMGLLFALTNISYGFNNLPDCCKKNAKCCTENASCCNGKHSKKSKGDCCQKNDACCDKKESCCSPSDQASGEKKDLNKECNHSSGNSKHKACCK